MLTVSYWMDYRAPNGGARESTQGAKGICNPVFYYYYYYLQGYGKIRRPVFIGQVVNVGLVPLAIL